MWRDMQQKDVCRNFIRYFGDNILVALSSRDSRTSDRQHCRWDQRVCGAGGVKHHKWCSAPPRCALSNMPIRRLNPITAFECTQVIPKLFTLPCCSKRCLYFKAPQQSHTWPFQCCFHSTDFLSAGYPQNHPTRWTPTSYKWSYNPTCRGYNLIYTWKGPILQWPSCSVDFTLFGILYPAKDMLAA